MREIAMRRSVLVSGVLAAGLSMVTTAPAAVAASTLPPLTLVGGGSWAGMVPLSLYPCTGLCSFTMTGEFSGAIQALDSNQHPTYTAAWPGSVGSFVGNLQVTSDNYTESCGSLPFVSPLTGSATGTFTISGGALVPASPSGSTIAQLTGTVQVSRLGGAFLLLTMSGVALKDGGGAVLATASGAGEGVGFFLLPVETASELESNPLPPNCANFASVTVPVAGTYVQPQ